MFLTIELRTPGGLIKTKITYSGVVRSGAGALDHL